MGALDELLNGPGALQGVEVTRRLGVDRSYLLDLRRRLREALEAGDRIGG